MLLLGKYWIVEWPELQSMFRARDQNTVKAFVSSQRDSFRPPYGRTTVEVPRSSIFVGTTNEEDFLTDDTGNRRYWVIGGCDQRFDLDRLTQWRTVVAHARRRDPAHEPARGL
jgi:predicted P-loop ATPase